MSSVTCVSTEGSCTEYLKKKKPFKSLLLLECICGKGDVHHQELVSCFRLDLTFKETRHGKHRKSSEEFVPSFAVLAASPKRLLRTASDLRSFSRSGNHQKNNNFNTSGRINQQDLGATHRPSMARLELMDMKDDPPCWKN